MSSVCRDHRERGEEGEAVHIACGGNLTHSPAQPSSSCWRSIVIVRCPGCSSLHLVADNIGWFEHLTEKGHNIEEWATADGLQIETGEEAWKLLQQAEAKSADAAGAGDAHQAAKVASHPRPPESE